MSIAASPLTFRAAVNNLHREKSAAYRNAWKRRGETISIIANIARKVDRLENVVDGAPATREESLLDTAVDLFIYVLKYQTFLADQDEFVARALFYSTAVVPPYSEGVEAFESLLTRVELTKLECPQDHSLTEATNDVLRAFARVEAAFVEPLASAPDRAERAAALEAVTVNLLGVLRRDTPERYYDFLVQQS
jgi:hypothetical protein